MLSKGSVEAPLELEVEDGGGLRGTPAGRPPSWRGVGILVFLTEDLSRPPLGRLAGQWPSSRPRVACLPHTSVSRLSAGAGLEAEESNVTPNPEVLFGGCTSC